ncbi:MAG: alpha/beta hydrolase, partial [Myxococcota bacterium]
MPREAEDNELPDLQRPGIGPVGPAIARAVGDAALSLTYRLVQARSRDPFTAPAESAPTRLYYTSDDGWRAPLFRFDPAPGGAGEPVLLAHGLGGSSRDWSIEPARCLAHALSAAGFSVYALEHRGDRSALPPEHARPFSVDDVATRDLGAAVDAVRAQTGFDRVLLVGHGLGGQVIYLRLALDGDEGIAGVVTMGAPVRFSAPASATRQAALAAMLLPAGWVLPGRRAQQLASPFVASGEDVASPGTTGPAARARLRYASGDLHGGVVKQAMRWIATGHLTDATGRLDVVAALSSFGPRRRAGG